MSKKIKWVNGDVFVIQLKDSTYSIGQVLDLQMTNIVRCAFFNVRFNFIEDISIIDNCITKNLISLVACSREQLDYGVWKIIGNTSISIKIERFPNENFRSKGWIGAKSYDAAIIEEFLHAYHSLSPWDDWFNPDYLDQLLVNISIKPNNLIYKNER